jgi:Ca2+-binding EF-hand superfamily protein
MKLKSLQGKLMLSEVMERFRAFDPSGTGRIKIYHFINILKHNYAAIFDQDTLTGLQFELECINSDDCVDYEEFVKIFMERREKGGGSANQSVDYYGDAMPEVKLDKKSTYQIQDYEDLMSKISQHIRAQGLDLMRIFKIFAK